MILTLLNIIIPVFAIIFIGFWFGRRHKNANMDFVNYANVMIFCPALVFSALFKYPLALNDSWLLIIAGTACILLPGLFLLLFKFKHLERRGLLVAGMFRNTGNIGIPLMMLAYGEDKLGAIIILFVLSNLLHFSVGIFLLAKQAGSFAWLKNPNVWAAVAGVTLAKYQEALPEFIFTTSNLLGQITIPLMLFALGVRISDCKLGHVKLALKVNITYLLVGALSFAVVVLLLPLPNEWKQLLALAVMLPPAVLNFLLCEQYRCEPEKIASIVLLGNIMSIVTIPLVVYLTLIIY